MPIFRISSGELKNLKSLSLNKEKNLQELVEKNLYAVFGLRFLASEYKTLKGRIDTLAVDAQGAPVIIEYKRNKDGNVLNQALSYLKWLRDQKADFFEMLMVKKFGKGIASKIRLDWNNPRVICIAESYSKYDLDAAEVVPLQIELFTYRFYEDSILSIEPLMSNSLVREVVLNEKPRIIDEWEAAISDWLKVNSKSEVGTSEILRSVFDMDPEKINGAKQVSMRVGICMRKLGWGKKRLSSGARGYVYTRPCKEAEENGNNVSV